MAGFLHFLAFNKIRGGAEKKDTLEGTFVQDKLFVRAWEFEKKNLGEGRRSLSKLATAALVRRD